MKLFFVNNSKIEKFAKFIALDKRRLQYPTHKAGGAWNEAKLITLDNKPRVVVTDSGCTTLVSLSGPGGC